MDDEHNHTKSLQIRKFRSSANRSSGIVSINAVSSGRGVAQSRDSLNLVFQSKVCENPKVLVAQELPAKSDLTPEDWWLR